MVYMLSIAVHSTVDGNSLFWTRRGAGRILIWDLLWTRGQLDVGVFKTSSLIGMTLAKRAEGLHPLVIQLALVVLMAKLLLNDQVAESGISAQGRITQLCESGYSPHSLRGGWPGGEFLSVTSIRPAVMIFQLSDQLFVCCVGKIVGAILSSLLLVDTWQEHRHMGHTGKHDTSGSLRIKSCKTGPMFVFKCGTNN